ENSATDRVRRGRRRPAHVRSRLSIYRARAVTPRGPGDGWLSPSWYTANFLMYFDFEDYRPDVPTIGRVISWREGILISIIVHLAAIILILVAPTLFPQDIQALRERLLAAQQQRLRDQARFVFVSPRDDRQATKPPARAELSDIDREARSRERAPQPTNPLP